MTEQQTSETTEAQGAEGNDEGKMIPESRFRGAVKQATEYKKRIAELEARQAEIDNAAKAEEEKRQIDAREFDKVLNAHKAKATEYEAEIATLKATMKRGEAERAVMMAGATDALIIKGLLADFAQESPEDLSVWIDAQKKAHPAAFAPTKSPMSTGPAGMAPPASQSSNTLESRLKSADRNVREAAIKEKFSAIMAGTYEGK